MIAYEIEEAVRAKIKAALHAPETGGILGINSERAVAEFYHDVTGTTTKKNYVPDTAALNDVIRAWAGRGIRFGGFVHAHPPRKIHLSVIDVHYAQKIKKYCGMKEIMMVIYIPAEENFYPYML